MTASMGTRLKAFGLDYLVVLAFLLVMGGVGALLTLGPLSESWRGLFSSPWRADGMAFLLSVLPVTLYFAVSEHRQGATWGKARMGLLVRETDGSPVSFKRSLVRSGLKFLPWQLSHTAMLHIPGFPLAPGEPSVWSLGLLLFAWTLVGAYVVGLMPLWQGRTLYDRIAGTIVVQPRWPGPDAVA